MLSIDYTPEEHTRQWISRYALYTIPFPPREIQEEIVRIVNSFSNLIDNINEEIAARQKQLDDVRE